jgi:hypothetical protein
MQGAEQSNSWWRFWSAEPWKEWWASASSLA